MRSGISFFDKTLFKKTVTRWWPIWASYLVLWIFILPVNLLMTNSVRYNYQNPISGTFGAQMVITMIFALFSAMAVLSHLYWPRSANFFGSLPVRREAQFVTLYLAGLSFLLVPDVIVACLTALAVSGSKVFSAGQAFAWLLAAAVDGFFFYSFAIVVGLLVGHILALPALYTIFNFLAELVVLILEVIAQIFYPSFNGFSPAVNNAAQWLTPSSQLGEVWLRTASYEVQPAEGSYIVEGSQLVNNVSWQLDGGHILAVYAGVAAVLTVLAFFLYRYRRLESAGDVVAVRSMRPVFKYGGALCAGLALGTVTSSILGEDSLPFTVTIWTVLSVFGAQMILDKTFKVFKKWKGAAVLGALVAAAFIVMAFDLTGFETRVPDPADVKSLEVSDFYGGGTRFTRITLTDPGEIEKFTALHKAAVEEGDSIWNGSGYVSMELTYNMKHTSLTRSVSVYFDPAEVNTPGTAAAAAEAIFADRDFWRRVYGLDTLKADLAAGGRVDEADYFYSYYDWYSTPSEDPEQQYKYLRDGGTLTLLNAEDITALTDAVLADFEDGLIERPRVDAPMDDPKTQRTITLSRTRGTGVRRISLSITPEAKRTYELIQTLIPRLLREQGLE